jgi:hypothetical protein
MQVLLDEGVGEKLHVFTSWSERFWHPLLPLLRP